jgi:hypothetical protein
LRGAQSKAKTREMTAPCSGLSIGSSAATAARSSGETEQRATTRCRYTRGDVDAVLSEGAQIVEVSGDPRCLSGLYRLYLELVERGRPCWRLREFREWSELGSAEVALAGDLNARETERDRSITRRCGDRVEPTDCWAWVPCRSYEANVATADVGLDAQPSGLTSQPVFPKTKRPARGCL